MKQASVGSLDLKTVFRPIGNKIVKNERAKEVKVNQDQENDALITNWKKLLKLKKLLFFLFFFLFFFPFLTPFFQGLKR